MSGVPPLPSAEEFRGKIAVVTGGTDGLGKHLTETLVSLGADVFFCARTVEKGRAMERSLGPRAHYVACDLEDAERTAAFARQAGDFRGRIDYLVNNAAIDPRIEFAAARTEDFDRLVAVNLRSYFIAAQAALPYLRAGEGKSVVNVCTTNYMFGFAAMTIYNAAKSGIVGFTRSLAREIGVHGIRVNTLSPGWIMTERQLRDHVKENDKRDLLASQCLKFLLTPEHVTPVTLFLLSRAAAGIAGQNLVVDGGKMMY
jgi:NAD(P)-dependent dehydrogenase (short-subunit alcohol dehydrogenase family)